MKFTLVSIIFTFLILNNSVAIAQNKILFDASKGETAGNADWVIDADTHNLGIGSSGAYIGGNESNPQRFPNPLQSTITASTPEDYWNGALSYWAIDCVKKGYAVESLPWNGLITYGVSSNPQDLSNYKAFIVDEPNIIFTTSEKTAIINYVANGGGLFMISDHDVSDRNNDGFDSPAIWNDLLTTNSTGSNPFGITFDYANFSGIFSNIANLPTDPILHGTTGDVTKVQWSAGTSMTLNTNQNPSVKGVVFKSGTSGLTNVLCAYGIYGSGKIAAVGDSSIADDGTGDSGDTLFDGYITDANGNHQRLLMNITNWLMASNLSNASFQSSNLNCVIAPNPIQNNELIISYTLSTDDTVELVLYDTLGRTIKNTQVNGNLGSNTNIINTDYLKSGLYLLKVASSTASKSSQILIP